MRARHFHAHRPPLWSFGAAIVAVSALFATYHWGVRGPGIDSFVSDQASRRLGFPVRLVDAEVLRWTDVRFGMMTFDTPGEKTLLACGKGRAAFDGIPLFKHDEQRMRIELTQVAILEDLFRGSPALAWASKEAFKDPIFVDRLEAVTRKKGREFRIHLTEFVSEDILLLGGARFERGKLVKGNLLILLPEKRFQQIPKEIRRRMIHRADGKHGVRVLYCTGNVTVMGAKGPFFKMRWK